MSGNDAWMNCILVCRQGSAKDVVVRTVNMGKLSLPEQIQMLKQSAMFVSVIGGAASTAMFLERNACLVLYFDDVDDLVKGADDPNMPNMMDWDFWNHGVLSSGPLATYQHHG